MNDLVFVMYNLKLKDRQSIKDVTTFGIDELSSDDEWITEESSHINSSNENGLDILDGATMIESGENEVGEDLESHANEGEDHVVHEHDQDKNDDEGLSDPLRDSELGSNDIFSSNFELEDDIDLEDVDDDGDGHSLDLDEDLNIFVNDLF